MRQIVDAIVTSLRGGIPWRTLSDGHGGRRWPGAVTLVNDPFSPHAYRGTAPLRVPAMHTLLTRFLRWLTYRPERRYMRGA